MITAVHNKLVSFIWSIADDCLRDVYVRGKYRDVILPMVVLRRLDALLEHTKDDVMKELEFQKNDIGVTEWGDLKELRDASGYAYYNTSKWTLQQLYDTATNNPQILLANFEDYLNGYSDNVKDILEKFDLRSKIRHMANKDVLLDVLEKFTSPYINLTDKEKIDPDGRKLPPLTNLGMGYVFEELIRRFNEENNEEAGEHFTPREVIDLMTHIIFEPVKHDLPPIITIYDPACGTGGMLTESQNFIKDQNGQIKANGDIYLYGKEINDETYAICKSDMMIKGNDPKYILRGSTLSTDDFSGQTFHYMLSNPPYGKSWSSEQKYIKDGNEVIDPRFILNLEDYWGNKEDRDSVPRSNDGQLLFLMEMVNKMKPTSQSPNGSRVASVHNGSSLFTGDAGSGESNIRRYIIENDWLECIIQMPTGLFYNTGISTYVWVLSNNKAQERKGKVQLIDASGRYRKLRKPLGEKNCEFTPEHISEIQDVYRNMKEIEREKEEGLASRVFANSDFGFYKVTIERPKRLKAQFSSESIESLRFDPRLKEVMQWAYQEFGDKVYEGVNQFEKEIDAWCEKNEIELTTKQRKSLFSQKLWEKRNNLVKIANELMQEIGTDLYTDFNVFHSKVTQYLRDQKIKLSDSEKNMILNAVSWYDAEAEKVIKRRIKLKDEKMDKLLDHLGCKIEQLPDYGYYPTKEEDEFIQYESESELRDYEEVPLKDDIYEYFTREVKPHIAEAWINLDATKIGYTINFNKYFYQHKSLRSLEEVTEDIMQLEEESKGLINEILDI